MLMAEHALTVNFLISDSLEILMLICRNVRYRLFTASDTVVLLLYHLRIISRPPLLP